MYVSVYHIGDRAVSQPVLPVHQLGYYTFYFSSTVYSSENIKEEITLNIKKYKFTHVIA
jgi:hypothetical protein